MKSEKIDLTNCDREPIHIPGAVQSHGVLTAINEPGLVIEQISRNCAEHFGAAAEELLGKSLHDLIGAENAHYLTENVLPQMLEANPTYLPALEIGGKWFEVVAHRWTGATIFEFECRTDETRGAHAATFGGLRAKINALNRTGSLREFCGAAAAAVREFTGFDRVMIYRFLLDGAGHVLAEARREDLESYLNLHYPAADIPQQARDLYLKQWLRFKIDTDDVSAPLAPTLNPRTGAPLDLSYAATRAMSPIHVEYLKNIGARASMSLSIIHEDKLWGLIACHHYAPRYVPHTARAAAEFLAHFLSLQVGAKEAADNYEYAARLKNAHAALIVHAGGGVNLSTGLFGADLNLLAEIEAEGAAMLYGDEIKTVGKTPDEARLRELAAWLRSNQPDEIFSSAELSFVYPPFEPCRDAASGVLAARLALGKLDYLFWFRGEYAHTVNWAGDPSKPVETGAFGERLTPRKSFALWQESVTGKSKPWLKCEIEHAAGLRHSLVEIILRQAEEIATMNKELERSNLELDSFAYVASHDLKEPLRGIHNYSHFLLEDYAEKLDETGKDQLQTLVRLTERMEKLLDTLLHFSRLGRTDLQVSEVDLNLVLEDSLALVKGRIEETGAKILIPRELPVIRADGQRIGEVFVNLVANALKYNDKDEKWVEIGFVENAEAPPFFYVRDNGIGIDKKHHDNVFRIFKRLHGREHFGGGVGAGLTIAKKIVERHGGKIWLESDMDKGTTFYFTLSEGSEL